MKAKILLFFIIIFTTTTSKAQISNLLSINDTRSINALPNFSSRSIIADFKTRSVIGVPGDGLYSTNLTFSQWGNTDNTGDKNHQLNFNNGGIFYRSAFPLDPQWGGWRKIILTDENGNVGIGILDPDAKLVVNGDAKVKQNLFISGSSGGYTTGDNPVLYFGINSEFAKINVPFGDKMNFSSYHGYTFNTSNNGSTAIPALTIGITGNVGIGITNPSNKLEVNGTIHSKEVKVDLTGWSDFVFKKEYTLPKLEEVEKHIKEKGHLENIPSEEEALKNGINLGEMNAKLLQKIEELTLYSIEQNKKTEAQAKKIEAQSKEIETLKDLVFRVTNIEKELAKK